MPFTGRLTSSTALRASDTVWPTSARTAQPSQSRIGADAGSPKCGTGLRRSISGSALRHAGDPEDAVLAARQKGEHGAPREIPLGRARAPLAVELPPSVRLRPRSSLGLPSPPCPRRADAYPSQSSGDLESARRGSVTRARQKHHVLTPTDQVLQGKPASVWRLPDPQSASSD